MSTTITIDPITRISGFLELSVEIEGNIIVNAKTSGLLFRGFEKMLQGRHPLDAIYFTERICGICSTAHAMASTLALEDALGVTVPKNDMMLRDLIHGFEFLQNHIRQFYYYTIPSYVRFKDLPPISPQEYDDFRLPERINSKISSDYFTAINLSRLAHEGLAVLGGKAPHNHGIFVGGVTVDIDSYKLEKVKSIVSSIREFATGPMTDDVNIIAGYYPDYFKQGISYPNFLSYGLFDKYESPELTYVKPGVIIGDGSYVFNPNEITEAVRYSWYKDDALTAKAGMGTTVEADLSRKDSYTFVKTPRYAGHPMEVGPLARLILSGEYNRGYSAMDRNIARVMEAVKISGIMERLLDRIQVTPSSQRQYIMPDKAAGTGLVDTTRGSLGHWIEIENGKIKHYDIITPTAWNLSPIDEKGIHGPGEAALMGSYIKNVNQPVEPGRIIRSFDPCISCATHITGNGITPLDIRIL